ncbi:hypothetical protein EBB07_09015 [Paenibacillaceae bacterium]|nr:hypothetical protein EBB07_09015 [Paenibacillaceae bacterium]
MMDSTIKAQLLNELEHGTVSKVYHHTYQNIVDRVTADGYFEESLTGAYEGEYCRTIGGLVSLFIETGELAKAQAVVSFIFDSMERNGLIKVPHVLGEVKYAADGSVKQWVGTDDQVDGRAHVIMAYSRLCLLIDNPAFENKYYDVAKAEMTVFLNQPYLYYQPGSNSNWSCTSMGLVFNGSFEHNREFRRWSTFDLLSQSFVGAAGEAMLELAKRRGDELFVTFLQQRMGVLTTGIEQHMTREVNGKKVYLEMRLPNGDWGVPYTGMGWVCYSPIAAQWEALDREVLDNTIELLREKLYLSDPLDQSNKITMLEYDEHHTVNQSVIGKFMGWDLEYSQQSGQYDKILNWFRFLNNYHTDQDLMMEQINYTDGQWVKGDCGNGEQCVWWCLAIARLRKELGLPVA